MPSHLLPPTIEWRGASVRFLDQTALPERETYVETDDVERVARAILALEVRGAPLIGIAAAYGMALAARGGAAAARAAEARLGATRPTAVNLHWALARLRRRLDAAERAGEQVAAALAAEALAIHDEDRRMCDAIGDAGAPLLPDGATVLTHCNAGALATGGIGTALAPVYRAHAAGRAVRVVACETRPLLQGARLTAWELARAGVPVTLITDGMAASRLARGDVACVLVGADRIAANGDTANKIGTYAHALAARAHAVPFYVAAPSSTFDPAVADGAAIPIEERRAEEILAPRGVPMAAAVPVWNPAFDVTPAAYVRAWITDRGVLGRGELGTLATGAGSAAA